MHPKSKKRITVDSARNWNFLSHHGLVLFCIVEHPESSTADIARLTGLSSRSVLNIIVDLTEDNFVHRVRVGRKSKYLVELDRPMMHHLETANTLGTVLAKLNRAIQEA